MPVSFSPPLYAICVGKTRLSHELISKSKAFVVNFVPYALKKEVLFCGRHSGRNLDKFKETGLKKEKAAKVDCPRIVQALATLECSVLQQIDAGDHTIFIGKILNAQFKKKDKRLFHLLLDDFTTTKKA